MATPGIIAAQRVTMHESRSYGLTANEHTSQVYVVRVAPTYVSLMSKARCGAAVDGGGKLRNMIGEVQLTREQAIALRDELDTVIAHW